MLFIYKDKVLILLGIKKTFENNISKVLDYIEQRINLQDLLNAVRK